MLVIACLCLVNWHRGDDRSLRNRSRRKNEARRRRRQGVDGRQLGPFRLGKKQQQRGKRVGALSRKSVHRRQGGLLGSFNLHDNERGRIGKR